MSARPRWFLARGVIIAAAAVAVMASQAIQPLSASAVTTAQHPPRPTRLADPLLPLGKPSPWSPAQAKPHPKPHPKVNAAALRAQAIAAAGRTERTASYKVSPAMLAFLRAGLGLPLGTMTTFTGVRSGTSLIISLPAPERLRSSIPGVAIPAFSRSRLVIDQQTGAATLTAPDKSGSLTVSFPDVASSTLSGLSSDVTLRVPVLGQTVTVSGPLGYRAGAPVTVSLRGALPAGVDLGRGAAELAAGATVTAATAGGLRVAGPAVLGPAGHQLSVTVAGAITGTSGWNLAVTSAGAAAPLAGLALSPDASGSITNAHGRVSYDVRGRTARPWTAAPGVTVSGTVEFSNGLPGGHLIPAPGLAGYGAWVDVTGTVALTSGVTTTGAAAINLTTGQGLLTSTGRTAVTLRTPAGRVIRDSAGFHGTLAVSPAAPTAASLPPQLSLWKPSSTGSHRPVQPAVRSVPKASTATAAASASYTLSGPVYDFITKTLGIPLGSATVTGTLSGSTLTLAAGAPASLPAGLPSWLPAPSYVSTQVTIDESANTVTLTAATGTTSGMTATLDVTIANAATSDLSDGTDVSGTLTLDGVPFVGGSTATLAFTLGYASGALSASLSGSLASQASFANGVVTIPAGTSLTLATGSGLTLSGAADLSYDGQTTEISVNGTLTSLSSWSLTASDATGQSWQPVTGLTVTPDFSGSISDTNGSIGFDLKAAGSSTAPITWVSPDGNSTLSVGGLELSNQAPASGADCTTPHDGDLWIGADGTFTYAPASLSLKATGCFDLTEKNATITTLATGDLTSEFGSTLPFSVTAVGLTAHIGGSYSLTGTATVTVTGGGVSNSPSFTVGVQLTSAGITAGVGVGDMSSLGFSGSGALYVSTTAVKDFDPSVLGITGQSAFSLPAGLSVSVGYTLPSSIESSLQTFIPSLGGNSIPGLTAGTSIQAVASLSSTGFSLDLGLSFGDTTSGLTVFNKNNSAFYLNRLDIGLSLGAENQVSLSGTGYVVLPPMAPGSGSSGVTVTVGGSFNITSATLSLGFNVDGWSGAFGVSGLSVQDFGGSLGLTLESGVPTPSLDIYADNIELPASWDSTLGVVPGAEIWFNADISLTQPVLSFSMYNQYGGPVLTPLAIDPYASPAVVNSLVVYTAQFVLAPAGGTTMAGDTVTPGVSVIFEASVDGVPVDVNAAVNLAAASVTASASVGAFTIGPVTTQQTSFNLNLSPTNLSFGITGGVSYSGFSFSASVQFAVGSSMAGAGISLSIEGGLPWWFGAGATLSGSISGDGSGASISASGSGYLYAAGNYLGPVSFSFSVPGSLSWTDVSNSIIQLAQFFVSDAQLGFQDIVNAMEQFAYDTYDIINSLSDIGSWGPQVVDALANAFGFSTTFFDIWTYTNSGEFLVMEVGGGSQAPNAGVDTWYWNNGYNQDWEFLQSPYSGWYEIVNRGSGQCLSVGGNNATPGNQLVQWPCSGAMNQLWYMGSIQLGYNYYIESALDGEYADVAGAYPWAGGTVDQWYYNGGTNQKFWLTNSGN